MKFTAFVLLIMLGAMALCMPAIWDLVTFKQPAHCEKFERKFVPLFPDGEKLDSMLIEQYK